MAVFIAEITSRAFIIADSNKRRTLSRSDIAKALNRSDQFDFLIDIVPREDPYGPATTGHSKTAVKKNAAGPSIKRDSVCALNIHGIPRSIDGSVRGPVDTEMDIGIDQNSKTPPAVEATSPLQMY